MEPRKLWKRYLTTNSQFIWFASLEIFARRWGKTTGYTEPKLTRAEDMTSKRNILAFIGTRPEAVKLAPVVATLRDTADFQCTVVATGQHKEMFRQVAETFGYRRDADLDVMRPNQSLAGLTALGPSSGSTGAWNWYGQTWP